MDDNNIKNVIELSHASFSYEKGNDILSDISFTIKSGECVGLIGSNGTGKSTLLKMLAGILEHKGEVKVFDLNVEKKNLSQIRKDLGLVFQDSDSQLFMPTLYDDMAFGPRNYGLSKEETEKAVDEALLRTNISHLKYKHNHKMSGGEKRMASIATILAMKPKIVLMDEPSIALDPFNRRTLINNLNAMPETKLIASHDLDLVYETCDRVILLDNKSVKADGDASVILRDKDLLTSCHLELPFCFQEAIPHSAR